MPAKGKGAAARRPAAQHEEEDLAELQTGAQREEPAQQRERAGPSLLDRQGVVHQPATVSGHAPRPAPCLQNRNRLQNPLTKTNSLTHHIIN